MKSTQTLSILSSVLAIAVLTVPSFAQSNDKEAQHFTRSFAVNPGSTLNVENYKGAIRISATSTNQIVVDVGKKFEGSDTDRKWWMSNTSVSFDSDQNRVRVGVQYPVIHCGSDCENEHSDYSAWVELTIQVPRRINLDLNGYKPEMKISGTEGDIHVHSYKAPIEIDSTTGAIEVSTYKESVQLRDVSLRSLGLSMEKGEATIEAKEIGGDLDIKTGKGTVVLRVPRNIGLNVDYSGGRRSNFRSVQPLTSEAGFHSGEITGAINGGGRRLRLRTEKGSISIEPLP